MKKPVNKFALALWLVAAVYVLAEALALYHITQLRVQAGMAPQAPVIWDGFRTIVMDSAVLVSLGMLVELVDQIRWKIYKSDRGKFKL